MMPQGWTGRVGFIVAGDGQRLEEALPFRRHPRSSRSLLTKLARRSNGCYCEKLWFEPFPVVGRVAARCGPPGQCPAHPADCV